MSPSEIDDVKKKNFLRKFVKNGVGQHTCQVLSSKYYSFRNYAGGGGGGAECPPPRYNQPFKSPVLIGLNGLTLTYCFQSELAGDYSENIPSVY